MEIGELQSVVDNWIRTIGVRYFHELTNMAILTEEVGELARVMSRMYGEQSFKTTLTDQEQKDKLSDELADVLWVLTCIANQTGVDLTDAIQKNMLKKILGIAPKLESDGSFSPSKLALKLGTVDKTDYEKKLYTKYSGKKSKILVIFTEQKNLKR